MGALRDQSVFQGAGGGEGAAACAKCRGHRVAGMDKQELCAMCMSTKQRDTAEPTVTGWAEDEAGAEGTDIVMRNLGLGM